MQGKYALTLQVEGAVRTSTSGEHSFGRYRLLFRLATGGMADLFVGRLRGAEGFEKLIVIKRIHDALAQDDDFVRMFIDEARLAARISHPNVVQVIDLGELDESYYIAMEYVSGESLAALRSRVDLPTHIAARVVAEAAAGLHAAHDLRAVDGEPLNVVHRDVSPQNVLIGYDGAVKVTDFGVARARSNLHETQVGTLKGKYAYMSPEQAQAEPVDRRSDVFALGIVLYEITTRHRLFKAPSGMETLLKVVEAPIVPPSQIVDDYPPRLEEIVMRALERDAALRFQSANSLHRALEQFIVSSGQPVLRSDIGDLMTRTFADRIEKKREMLQHSQRSDTMPEVELRTPSVSDSGKAASMAQRERVQIKRRRKVVAVAAISSLVLGVAVFSIALYLLLARSPKEEGPPAQKSIKISIRATPPNAVIKIDGKPVKNPFNEQRIAEKGSLKVAIEAPGHLTRTIDLPLDEDSTRAIELVRTAPSDGASSQPASAPALAKAQDASTPKKAATATAPDAGVGGSEDASTAVAAAPAKVARPASAAARRRAARRAKLRRARIAARRRALAKKRAKAARAAAKKRAAKKTAKKTPKPKKGKKGKKGLFGSPFGK